MRNEIIAEGKGSEPDELIIDTVYVTDEECPGYNNGSINIFIDGGTTPFRFSATGGAP